MVNKAIPGASGNVSNRFHAVFFTFEAGYIKIFRHRSCGARVNITTLLEKNFIILW